MFIVSHASDNELRSALCAQGIGWTGARLDGKVVFICEQVPEGIDCTSRQFSALREDSTGGLELMLKDVRKKYSIEELQ